MDENFKMLEKELKYLTDDARNLELKSKEDILKNGLINVSELANKIYLDRGLDIEKIKSNTANHFINDLSLLFSNFSKKEKRIKRNIIIDFVYLIILIVLTKIPFDLVRDIGLEYIEIINNNTSFIAIWNLIFLIFYTIIAICIFIALIKNIVNKYK